MEKKKSPKMVMGRRRRMSPDERKAAKQKAASKLFDRYKAQYPELQEWLRGKSAKVIEQHIAFSKRSPLAQFVSNYCGTYYGIEDQREGESDGHFQDRVYGLLRAKGRLIEAHEVRSGARWDDKEAQSKGGMTALDGIAGAMLLALNPDTRMGENDSYNRLRMQQAIDFDGKPREDVMVDAGTRIAFEEGMVGMLDRDKRENPPPPLGALLLAMGISPFDFQTPEEIMEDLNDPRRNRRAD